MSGPIGLENFKFPEPSQGRLDRVINSVSTRVLNVAVAIQAVDSFTVHKVPGKYLGYLVGAVQAIDETRRHFAPLTEPEMLEAILIDDGF